MPRHRLTDEQKQVAASRAPRLFVESVPGSGKTTVAAERFGVLRHAHNCTTPRAIVAVSFARSAVIELHDRVGRRWGSRTTAVPNAITTMDGLHRSVVEFLLRTQRLRWPGGTVRPRLIDSWARQRGATRISVTGPRNQRWELGLKGDNLALAYRAVDAPCWGMMYAKRADFVESLADGVCTHDEIRQIVGLALGRADLRDAIDEYLARSFAHLIVDEAFDLNGLDALLVRRVVESGVGVTLVGDPWQALYEWRGARPDMVHQLLHDYSFETLPMHTSFRFKTSDTMNLARDLRHGQGVVLPATTGDADVVLASEWEHLVAAGDDVIPLSFGQFDCQTDAAVTLLLDEVARARLGKGALNLPEAHRCLRRDPEVLGVADVLELLRDPSVGITAVMTALREATKVQGQRRPSLPAARVVSRCDRLTLLRQWLTVDGRYVPGLSFHQAKGREWGRVDVALGATARAALGAGLDGTKEDHRKLYVALTRGSTSTRVRPI
jgi:DNA helicase-2/ATP-dependent DNA helicase PcrA